MATLHVTLDLPEWDEPEQGYRSLQGQIVREATEQLFNELKARLTEDIRAELRKRIQAEVGTMLADVVNMPVRKTNAYGEPKGKETSLRELVVEDAAQYLQQAVRLRDGKVSDYHSDKTVSRLAYMTSEAVRRELETAFSERILEVVDKAKAEIDEHLTSMIKDAIKTRLDL